MIIQIKLSCFLCRLVSHTLSCRVGVQAVQDGLSCPPPPHLRSWVLRVKFFHAHFTCFKYLNMVDSFITIIQVKLSCCLCCLISLTFVAGVGGGGKLSRAVYLAPHLGIMFNFFLMLISLVSNFLYMKLYHL